jgi:hypothetical protein
LEDPGHSGSRVLKGIKKKRNKCQKKNEKEKLRKRENNGDFFIRTISTGKQQMKIRFMKGVEIEYNNIKMCRNKAK